MKRRLLLLGLPALACIAGAQTPVIPDSAYRRGMPEVLTQAPPPPPAASFDRRAFAAAYARAGRPTIALLWNRAFTDLLQQDSASQIRIDTTRAGVGTQETAAMPGYLATQRAGVAAVSTTITAAEVKSNQPVRSAPVERVDLELRSAFVQTLAGSGVRLVDRNVVMRTTAAKTKGPLDSQQVETNALGKHAALLMEVLNTPDPASPTGWATYVSIKRLDTGVVLTEGYMTGQQPEQPKGPTRFEADPRGGFREVVAPVPVRTVTDVGRLIAEQTLTRMAGAF